MPNMFNTTGDNQKSKSSKNILELIFIGVGVFVFIAFVIYCIFTPADKMGWTGFKKDTEITHSTKKIGKGEENTETTKYISDKTLWDWMALLIAPASLAVFGLFLQSSQQQARDRKEEQEKRLLRELEADRQREEALQNYTESILKLLSDHPDLRALAEREGLSALNKKLNKKAAQELEEKDKHRLEVGVDIIQIRTLSVLRRLIYLDEHGKEKHDGKRKGSVIELIADLDALGNKVMLFDANLSGMILTGKVLIGLTLGGVYIDTKWRGADLREADLRNISLIESDLGGVDLTNAKLNRSYLGGTYLLDANLTGADLQRAFIGGVSLTGANLKDVKLEKAIYDDSTTLPEDPEIQAMFHEQAYKITQGANLRSADLADAKLYQRDLSYADLQDANLTNADLQGTNLRGAKGLTIPQIKAAARWKEALYDPDFRTQLGLPPEVSSEQKPEVSSEQQSNNANT